MKQIRRNVCKITSNFTLNFPLNFLKSWKLHKISTEICRKFIQTVVCCFSEDTFSFFWRFWNIFQFFSKCYPGLSNFLVFTTFLPSFLKTISVFLCSKILQPNSKTSPFSMLNPHISFWVPVSVFSPLTFSTCSRGLPMF